MKNNKTKNIYTLSMASIVVALVFSYIVCVYKTVVLAAESESNNKKISILTDSINQKDFDYIEKVSSIDLDKAIALGYQKNNEDKVAYFNIKENSEFARR
jgi:hypothetical protein